MKNEERDDDNKVQMIFGCRYEETNIQESFKNACGRYEMANENLKDMKGSCLLSIKNDMIVLKMKLLGTKDVYV